MTLKVNQEKLIKLLHEKWNGIACPYCQSAQWNVDPAIMTTIEVGEDKGMKIGGRFMPFITVMCKNCGNTVLVNSLVLGCLEGIDNKEENGEK